MYNTKRITKRYVGVATVQPNLIYSVLQWGTQTRLYIAQYHKYKATYAYITIHTVSAACCVGARAHAASSPNGMN